MKIQTFKLMKSRFFTLGILHFLFLLLFINSQSLAQYSNNKSIKLYTNFNFVTEDDVSSTDSITNNITTEKNKNYQLGYFSPAYTIELTNGNFHEFEISRFLINQEQNQTIISNDSLGRSEVIAGVKSTKIFVAFRYEYNFSLGKKTEETKFHPYVGISINPFFENAIIMPTVSSQFPKKQVQVGALLAIVPRINYDIKGNWYMDLNVPINIFEANVDFSNDQNPILSESERKTTEFNIELFPNNIMVRIGIGLRI